MSPARPRKAELAGAFNDGPRSHGLKRAGHDTSSLAYPAHHGPEPRQDAACGQLSTSAKFALVQTEDDNIAAEQYLKDKGLAPFEPTSSPEKYVRKPRFRSKKQDHTQKQ